MSSDLDIDRYKNIINKLKEDRCEPDDDIVEALQIILDIRGNGNANTEENLREAIGDACGNGINLDGLETEAEKELVRVLVRLKRIAQNLLSRRVRFNRNKTVLLDTCYSETKAKKFSRALKKIHNRIADNNFKKFLLLLASVYATMLKRPGKMDRLEWFPLLVRAFVEDEGYIPVCPTRGDVTALVIKLLLLDVDNITVDRSDVEFILKKLVGLTEASNQGNNQD